MSSGSTDCAFPTQGSKTLVTDRADGLLQSFVSGFDLTEMVINIAAAIKQQPTTTYLRYMTSLRSVAIERRKRLPEPASQSAKELQRRWWR